ncbi:hypothetical protein LAZ67_X001685 [Cordylochernes scorpioides]|uniref:Uncharacterized protein n=1 Tax=Cordylochernes scorpioides TaxID=51811 RepID=A0ABY6LV77_9ARAC|nr:hypothetical protein LAZ67_X001685 [Cordylochernes scorpioides]
MYTHGQNTTKPIRLSKKQQTKLALKILTTAYESHVLIKSDNLSKDAREILREVQKAVHLNPNVAGIVCCLLEFLINPTIDVISQQHRIGMARKAIPQLWFKRFRSGDFNVNDKKHGKPPKKFEEEELQAVLDEDDALKHKNSLFNCVFNAMGKIQKEGKWLPHELSEKNKENRRIIAEILLERFQRKSVIHRIVTGDEKWLYFDDRKRKE